MARSTVEPRTVDEVLAWLSAGRISSGEAFALFRRLETAAPAGDAPGAPDDERQQLEAFRPALLACLESHEASPDDPGMDIYELIDYSNQRGIEPGWQGLDCTTEVNVSVG